MSESKVADNPQVTKADPDSEIVELLLSMAKSTRALVSIKLAELDFHKGQDELILALDRSSTVSVSNVAALLNIRPSTVSKMAERLIAKKLIRRTADTRDARRTMVQLTPAGLEARSKLLKVREELEADLLASWKTDTEDALQSLESVAELLKQRLSRLR